MHQTNIQSTHFGQHRPLPHSGEVTVCWMAELRVQLYVSLKVSLCVLESGSAVGVCARLKSRLGLVDLCNFFFSSFMQCLHGRTARVVHVARKDPGRPERISAAGLRTHEASITENHHPAVTVPPSPQVWTSLRVTSSTPEMQANTKHHLIFADGSPKVIHHQFDSVYLSASILTP